MWPGNLTCVDLALPPSLLFSSCVQLNPGASASRFVSLPIPHFPELSGRPRKFSVWQRMRHVRREKRLRVLLPSLQTGSREHRPWQRTFWLKIPVTTGSHLFRETSVSQREAKQVKAGLAESWMLADKATKGGCQQSLASGLAWYHRHQMLGEVLGSYIHSKGSIPFSPLGYQACWAGLPDKAR